MTIGLDFQSLVLDMSGSLFEQRMSEAEQLNVLTALADLDGPEIRARLAELAEAEMLSPRVRHRAASLLARRGDPTARQWLEQALLSLDADMRLSALRLTESHPELVDESTLPRIMRLAHGDPNRKVRAEAQGPVIAQAGSSPLAAHGLAKIILDENDDTLKAGLADQVMADGSPLKDLVARVLATELGKPERSAEGRARHVEFWDLLTRLRRAGARFKLEPIPWLRRVRFAFGSRKELPSPPRPGLGRSIQLALLGTAIAILVVLQGLAPALLRAFVGGEIFLAMHLLGLALLAAANVWFLGRFVRPVSASAGRWAIIPAELTGLALPVVACAFFDVLILATFIFFPGESEAVWSDPHMAEWFRWFLVTTLALLLTRVATMVGYGLSNKAGRRFAVSAVAGAAVGYAVLDVGMLLFALPRPDDVELLGGYMLLQLTPLIIAVATLFSSIDAAVDDAGAVDTPALRLMLLTPLLALSGFVMISTSWLPPPAPIARAIPEGKFELSRTLDQPAASYLVPLGTPVRLHSTRAQPTHFEVRAGRDIRVELRPDATHLRPAEADASVISRHDGTDLETLSGVLHAGEWSLTVAPPDNAAPDESVDQAAHRLRAAGVGNLLGLLEHAPWLDPTGAVRQHLRSASPDAGHVPHDKALVRIGGGIAADFDAHHGQFERQLRALLAEADNRGPEQTGYAVVVPLPYGATRRQSATVITTPQVATGTIVHRAAVEAPLDVLRGRAVGRRFEAGSIDERRLLWIDRAQAAALMTPAGTVALHRSTAEGLPYLDTLWARLLAAGAEHPAALATVAEIFEASRTETITKGYALGPEASLMAFGAGGIFRIRGDADGELVEGELIIGWAPAQQVDACFRLRADTLTPFEDVPAADWRDWLALVRSPAPESLSNLVAVDRGQASPDAAAATLRRACVPWEPGEIEVRDLGMRTGAYMQDAAFDLMQTWAPDVFWHYFVVMEETGTHEDYLPPGTIVRGLRWIPGETPGYDVILGWGKCGSSCYIEPDALTDLGPVFKPIFALLPRRLRADWTPEQAAQYEQAELTDRTNEVYPPLDATTQALLAGLARQQGTAPDPPQAVPPIATLATQHPGALLWNELATLAGAWLDDFEVTRDSAIAPLVFSHYFLVADSDVAAAPRVARGTIVRGSAWPPAGRPTFAPVYGWAAGAAPVAIDPQSLTYLGPVFAPQWLRLPILGQQSDPAFASQAADMGFVDRICSTEAGNVCTFFPPRP